MDENDYGTRRHQYFVPGEGIAREVITSDICKYLDNDATVRPATYQGRDGYIIYAYRNLTSAMMEDLKKDTARWIKEKAARRTGRGGGSNRHENRHDPYHVPGPMSQHDIAMQEYQDSQVHERRSQVGPSQPPGAMPMDTTLPPVTSSPHGSADGYPRPPYTNPSPQHPGPYPGMNNPNAQMGNPNMNMPNQPPQNYGGNVPYGAGYQNDYNMGPPQQQYDPRYPPQQAYDQQVHMGGMPGANGPVPGGRGYDPGQQPGPQYQREPRPTGPGRDDYYDYPSSRTGAGSKRRDRDRDDRMDTSGYNPSSSASAPRHHGGYPDSSRSGRRY